MSPTLDAENNASETRVIGGMHLSSSKANYYDKGDEHLLRLTACKKPANELGNPISTSDRIVYSIIMCDERFFMKSLPLENLQHYPRPPALEPVDQQIVIRHAGELIAQSDHTYRVLETHHTPTYYLPVDDIVATLKHVNGSTFCELKGVARYFDLIT